MSRESVSRFGLGRLLYLGWYKPRAIWHRSRREGGPWQQWLDRRGRAEMERAAWRLPARQPKESKCSEVYFLTGRRFWFQTAFCCWSLARHSEDRIAPVFIDDGTFDDGLQREAMRVFPNSRVEWSKDVERRLDDCLPRNRFPRLRKQREGYVHLRKVTDVHAGRSGFRIVLDSDMLFFKRPEALMAWFEAPTQPVHMEDVQNAYGYPDEVLGALITAALPPRLNVGITGLDSSALDWNQWESWCDQLLREQGSSYYLEQALVALALAGKPAIRLARSDYLVMPDAAEAQSPTAVLHHYVDLSKRGYFRHGWRVACPPEAARA